MHRNRHRLPDGVFSNINIIAQKHPLCKRDSRRFSKPRPFFPEKSHIPVRVSGSFQAKRGGDMALRFAGNRSYRAKVRKPDENDRSPCGIPDQTPRAGAQAFRTVLCAMNGRRPHPPRICRHTKGQAGMTFPRASFPSHPKRKSRTSLHTDFS